MAERMTVSEVRLAPIAGFYAGPFSPLLDGPGTTAESRRYLADPCRRAGVTSGSPARDKNGPRRDGAGVRSRGTQSGGRTRNGRGFAGTARGVRHRSAPA